MGPSISGSHERGASLRQLRPGQDLPVLCWTPTRYDLLRYASVSRDLNLIHHDPLIARASGLPDTIVQGTLKAALMARVALRFAGLDGRLRRLSVQYRGVDVPEVELTGHGRVLDVDLEAGLVSLELWVTAGDGSSGTRGGATVWLPDDARER